MQGVGDFYGRQDQTVKALDGREFVIGTDEIGAGIGGKVYE